MATESLIVPSKKIVSKIYVVRNKKVMLDRDLSELYGVTTGNLNLSVKRNIKKFPEDFMFQLNKAEFKNLILQIETSSWGGTRKTPFAFLEKKYGRHNEKIKKIFYIPGLLQTDENNSEKEIGFKL